MLFYPELEKYGEGFEWPTYNPADALRALARVREDPDRTDDIAIYIWNFSGLAFQRMLKRTLADPEGRRVLESGKHLVDTLNEREKLAALPVGSLGREYYERTEERGFDAEGISGVTPQTQRHSLSPAALLASRAADMHDLWHVINGWDFDYFGEMHMMGFSAAQFRSIAWFALGAFGFNYVLVGAGRLEGIEYFAEGFRRGLKAKDLSGKDWEGLLALPIDQVREQLHLEEPRPYTKMNRDEYQHLFETSLTNRALTAIAPFLERFIAA